MKFHMQPEGKGRTKSIHMVVVTWPRWPPCQYLVKTFKKLFLQNQWAETLEAWHQVLEYYQICRNEKLNSVVNYYNKVVLWSMYSFT